MGIVQDVAVLAGPLAQQFTQLGVASQVGIVIVASLLLSVLLNVLNQVLFKRANEPPMVFHLFPIIGSTITYGLDPPPFFKENRAKVSLSAATADDLALC